MLIKSTQDGPSIYRTHDEVFRWDWKGAIIDVPQKVIDEPPFQRSMEKGLLVYADQPDRIMYTLSHPKSGISHAV